MLNYLIPPRILFVVYEAVFMPEGSGGRTNFINDSAGGFGDFPAEPISSLIELGCDVHVAQPDFRNLFEIRSRKEKSGATVTLPCERIHLAKDRTLFYSKPIISNSHRENLKISLAFQREVINQIIPRVQPDLIHCYDWMTGLIPAAAKKNEIPCLFTIQKLDSARSMLADVEEIGIDAAGFWQNLFYDRYPGSYEQTRDTNPLDLLLSGILAANHVNAARPVLLPTIAEGRYNPVYAPLKQVLGTGPEVDGRVCLGNP
jgi:starch synthase/alpha-amylase